MGGILWLASYPKSGNTWLRVFLQNLLTNARETSSLDDLNLTLGDSQSHLFQHLSSRPVDELSPADIAALRGRAQAALSQTSPDAVMVKTHAFLGEYLGYPQISMDHTAGAIYVIRNPLDVCISLAPHFGISLDQSIEWMADATFDGGGGAGEVPYRISSWSQHVKSWVQNRSSDALHVVRYEDLSRKPLPTFKALTRFLGLKPPPDALKKAIKLSSFSQLQKQEAEKGFSERSDHAERFFRVGKAGQWKTVLSKAQIDAVVAEHHEVMKEFHYLP